MIDTAMIINLLRPLALILCGLVGGLIFEKRILKKIKQILEKKGIKLNLVISEYLRGVPFVFFFVLGIYVAIVSSSLNDQVRDLLAKMLLAIILGTATLVASRLALGFVRLYSNTSEGVLPLTSLFENLTNLVIFTIGTLIILQSIGISITPLLTALGVGGLSIGLALQATLGNLVSGVNIIMSRKVNPGDYVKLETGEEGYVTDVTWRHTTIREYQNNLIVVPNAKLVSSTFKNYHLPQKEMMVMVELGVGYDNDLEKVEQVTIAVAEEVMSQVAGCVPEFQPFMRYHTFGYFSINFTVYLASKEFIDHLIARHEFMKLLYKRYQEEGINIPFPIQPVYLPDKSDNSPQETHKIS
ncbi:MAG TPA: mechanosensitive ion channel family protein [Oscillatoriaceae cyanobacterium M33_DOE_052]|uniref:Mechanosensitive ion channel family protein n=1 Tax=Planktothricoides sp. SpSt-374 TaxID=2282167 RepID=A0A7C3VQC7_9CYAN|nr:mechanosensitive ion channel family protein [Oscillatoriaceae cyanobacterium M33_DOE_052]